MDNVSREKRSEIMSKIRSRGTRPEILFHNSLNELTVGHKMHPKIVGNPDVLIGNKTAVFINGCFWHGCKRHYKEPKTNKKFWRKKISDNKKRQKKSIVLLRKIGYKTIIIWEHDLRSSQYSLDAAGALLDTR